MIDPLVSLAFSIQANRGVYALLLGSGVSRSAQIPTGWEIVLDLIRKLAILEGVDCEPDPAAWYKEKFGEYPDYSKLLSQIVYSAPERRELLRPYFEPTEEEREEGLKLSTEAHQAIANLVASGYIRMIITTNFDRLLENALGSIGIAPTVISTKDAAIGALPLITHSTGCIIVKVNGDYLDQQTKNTADELADYPKPVGSLLDRIFDEFGLIVCGWSGDSDIALRTALEKCSNHRFTTYWMDIKEPTGNARNLINIRRGKFISIQNADSFFYELAEKVFALEEYSKPHPLSVNALVAQVEKYIVEERYKIRLNNLMNQEVEELYRELSDKEKFPVEGFYGNDLVDEFRRQVMRYDSLVEKVMAMMITGCRWGKKSHEHLWISSLERIANPPEERVRNQLYNLKRHMALLLLYSSGIISVATENYGLFYSLLTKPKFRSRHRDWEPLVRSLSTWSVIEMIDQKSLPDMEGISTQTPYSDYLYRILREPLKEFLPQETRYQKCFDRFEYLYGLVQSDFMMEDGSSASGHIGSFGWRYVSIMEEIESEASEAGGDWPLLQTGFFGSDIERFEGVKKEFDDYVKEVIRGRGWR